MSGMKSRSSSSWCISAACLFLLGGAVAAPKPALPAPTSGEPVLRIETGVHLALITKIGTDGAGRWIVTASEDKTARIWNAVTGKPVSVLRPPIGEESAGTLYAAAISPDGRQVALGGNGNFDGSNTHALYLFDRASGALPPKSTLSGLEAPLTQIAWSRDSQFIAIGLRQEGLRVFRRNLGFVGADPEYNEAIYGADFSRDGRLITASLDGALRLYIIGKAGLERVARHQAPGGKPYSVAFSPDGALVALGYQDGPRVDVLDTNTLELAYTAQVRANGNLGRVAWSDDGQILYAGGSANSGGRFLLYAFADAGRGQSREIGSFANTITGLATLGAGVVAASAEPSWAAFDGSGISRIGARPQSADFRDAGENFRVADDGHGLVFPMMVKGPSLVFDLSQGSLKQATPGPELKSPRLPKRGSGPADWKNSLTPKLDGRALPLRPGEVSRSAALAGDNRFVLGTDWNLRLFDANGRALWERRIPAAAWAVNITGDSRWAIAGLGDGTVRWYRLADGLEQLALFVHADQERWIIWSPKGYYDTSIGGENLVGWHLNRAFNQSADFFSVGRFRERFYQPGTIQKILALADEDDAERQTRQELAAIAAMNAEPVAPVQLQAKVPQEGKGRKSASVAGPAPAASARLVEIVPPIIELQSDSQVEAVGDLVTVRYAVRTPQDAPVKDIKIRVNGRLDRSIKPVSQRALQGEIPVQEVQVRVPPGKDAEILLIAENRNAKSDPVSIKVSRGATMPKAAAGDKADFETLYMLVVAVNKYPGANELVSPVKDANAFKAQMARIANPPAGVRKIYNRIEFKMLTDDMATRENILEGLKWLKTNMKEKDAGVLFLSGHGIAQGKSYYYIPFKPGGMAGKPEEWLPGDQIVGTLQSLPGRAMFFLDTCYAGALTNQASNATDIINKIDDERGVIVFASSTGKEKSGEDDENGFFTKALIEGLRGEAVDKKDNLIYPTLLKRYVTRRVKELSDNQQRPFISDHGIDEPIAIVIK